MKRLVLWLGCLGLIAGLTGCVENAILVKLKRDGSGTLVYRLYISESMAGMMQSAATGGVDLFSPIKDGLGEQLGGAVTLESSRELTSQKGWPGIEAVFAFDDINALKLHDLDPMGNQAGAGASEESIGEDYTLQFTPGEVATLKLAPMVDADVIDTAGATSEETEVDMSDMPMDMIKPMLAGMRMSFLVAVEGEIVETNARFRSEKQPNVITVMDIRMDRLLDHPEGSKLIQSGRGEDAAALAALEIPGIKMEEPGKEIVIRFK